MIFTGNESFDIKDVCLFALELEMYKIYDVPLYIDIELYYSDLRMIGGISNLTNYINTLENIADFRVIDKKTFQISFAHTGLHHAIKVDFNDRFTYTLTLQVFSIITGLKYENEGKNELERVMFKGYDKSKEEDVKEIIEKYITFVSAWYKELLVVYNTFYKSDIMFEENKESIPIDNKPNDEVLNIKELVAELLKNPNDIAKMILSKVNEIAQANITFWNKYLDFLSDPPKEVEETLVSEHIKEIRDHCSHFIIKSEQRVSDMKTELRYCPAKVHKKIIEGIYKSKQREHITPIPIQEVTLLGNEMPTFFEEKMILDNEIEDNIQQSNLVILVHGFQGSRRDMITLKSALSITYPQIHFMCSSVNEPNTNGDINFMAKEFAREVKEYIKNNDGVLQLSFIGFSLGGLIIRGALPLLEEYKDKMNTFITLSTPHLGCTIESNKLITMGIWAAKRVFNSDCLRQLLMIDKKDIKESFIYKVSKYNGLEWFKRVVLLSSFLDCFSPYESARIEIHRDIENKKLLKEIADNILSHIKVLYRIDVAFTNIKPSIDSFIGRAAHIEFLENQGFIKMFAYCYEKFLI